MATPHSLRLDGYNMQPMMENSWPEMISPASGTDRRQTLVDELLRGQDIMEKLKALLRTESSHHRRLPPSMLAEDLVVQVVESMNKTISMLSGDDKTSQLESSLTTTKSEDSEESCRSSPARGDGRGRYKRRRKAETWSEITSALTDDGHAWRKYGQKSILNSDFPRSYYRCTHKQDQGCEATKQVQKISSHPPIYSTTYQSRHTCKTRSHPPPVVFDSLPDPAETSSVLLSFDRSAQSTCIHPFPNKLGAPGGAVQKQLSSPDYLVPPNRTILTSSTLLDPGIGDSEMPGACFGIGFANALLYDL